MGGVGEGLKGVCVCVCEVLYNSRWQMEYRLAKHLLIVMLNSLFTGFSAFRFSATFLENKM